MEDFHSFVTCVCELVDARILRPKPGTKPLGLYGLAINAIPQSRILPGVGRYTVEEVFLRAGLWTPFTPFNLLLYGCC